MKVSISITAMLVSRNAFNFQMAENQRKCPVKMKINVNRILLQIISCKFMIMINHHINRARQNTFQAFYDYSWCAIEKHRRFTFFAAHLLLLCFIFLHLIHVRAHTYSSLENSWAYYIRVFVDAIFIEFYWKCFTFYPINFDDAMKWFLFWIFILFYFLKGWKSTRNQPHISDRAHAIACEGHDIHSMNEWMYERMREFKKSNKSSFIGVCLCHWSHCISRIYEWIAFILSFLCQ